MRWKGQHGRDEARLRDRLWSATVGQALPEEPIRQPARTAPEKLAGVAGRGTQREGGRDHRRRATRDHQARGGCHSTGQRIGRRRSARHQVPIDMDMLNDAEKKADMRRRGSSRVSTLTLRYTRRATRDLAEIAEYSSARKPASARRIMSAHAFDRNFGSIEIECGMSRPTNIGCNRCAS